MDEVDHISKLHDVLADMVREKINHISDADEDARNKFIERAVSDRVSMAEYDRDCDNNEWDITLIEELAEIYCNCSSVCLYTFCLRDLVEFGRRLIVEHQLIANGSDRSGV